MLTVDFKTNTLKVNNDLTKDEIKHLQEKWSMDYNKLTSTNNFVFCKVLENNLDLCRQLLELILSVKIKKIELADKKILDITPDGKSVRLDIFVVDSKGTVYNIEMQVAAKRNLPKRSRYRGMIDCS